MKLKDKRIEKGYSQSELANIADVPLRSLQDYERGHRDFNIASVAVVKKLADALDCRIEDIID